MSVAEELQAAIDAYQGRADLCGAMRISRDGELLLERAFGQASVQMGVDNRPDTRFHIASVTKMFTSAAAVELVTEGALSLQAHPSTYVPALARVDPRITLHHLLSHTSGLVDIYDRPGLQRDLLDLAASGGRLLDYLATLPQQFAPGEKWGYSTSGFLLLAYVLEEVADARFDKVIRKMFLDRLGMPDTGPDDPYRVNPGRALGHIDRERNAANDRLAQVDAPREFYSTIRDLDRWGVALLNREVLNDAGLDLTFSRHAAVGLDSDFNPGFGYGYGWFLGDGFRWIGGMTEGFRSAMWQYPAERLNVVMLWNSERIDSQGLFARLRPILLR